MSIATYDTRITELINLLKSGPHNMNELAYLMATSIRTVYRYMEKVRASGFEITKTEEGFLIEHKCPLCGK